jgi:hypothetical protein
MKIILPYEAYKNQFFNDVVEAANRGCLIKEVGDDIEQELDSFKHLTLDEVGAIYENGGSVEGYEFFAKIPIKDYRAGDFTTDGYEKDGFRYVLLSIDGELMSYQMAQNYTLISKEDYMAGLPQGE